VQLARWNSTCLKQSRVLETRCCCYGVFCELLPLV
jgi:hypothetical protein